MRNTINILFVSIFVMLFTFKLAAQESNYRFHKVFFYSFTKYIDWPEKYKEGDFIIGVFGDSDITPLLKEMAEIKKVGNQNIVVKTISEAIPTQKMNIIFIPDAEISNFETIKEQFVNKPTLIITETANMATKGSMINFKDVDGKLKFELNTALISKEGLKVSKELVRFGEEIK